MSVVNQALSADDDLAQETSEKAKAQVSSITIQRPMVGFPLKMEVKNQLFNRDFGNTIGIPSGKG